MRKLVASILLIPFAILFLGFADLSSVCPATPEATCNNQADQCCHKQQASCPKQQASCPKKQAPCPKQEKADHSDCCLNCPLCALITIPPFIRFEPAASQSITEYAVSPDNRLTDYNQPHWKPPDTAGLS